MIVLCFFITYFVWGSTYLANVWAIREVPTFLLIATRFAVAGVILLFIARVYAPLRATKRQIRNSAIAGLLFFTFGNGLSIWALNHIDSGLAAIIIALQPLIIVFIEWAALRKRPNGGTIVGICLGFVGIAVLSEQPQFHSGTGPLLALGALLAALISWGIATVWLPRADLPDSMFERVAMQMLFGSVVLFFVSAGLGEFSRFDPSAVTRRGAWSFVYLVVFGSLAAMTAFNYLLVKVPPTKVVTNTYVNPIIAVFCGWKWNKESVGWTTLVAGAFLLAGVYVIVQNKGRRSARSLETEPDQDPISPVERRGGVDTGSSAVGESDYCRTN